MKKTLLLMLLLVQCVVMSAQMRISATERAVGFVEGDDISTSDYYLGLTGSQNLAALVSNTTLNSYAGCKVVGIRFALSQSIGRSGVFMYSVSGSGAEMLVNSTVRRTSDGWNEVRFNSSQEYVITGKESLLFGFSYEETAEMVAAKKGALCFSKSMPTSDDATLIQKADGFYTLENTPGNICVQLIVDMSSRVQKAIRITSLMTGVKYKKPGSSDYSLIMFSNSGVQDITNVDFVYQIDGSEPRPLLGHIGEVKSGMMASDQFIFDLPEDIAYGPHTFTVSVNKIDGQTPSDMTGATLTEKFVVYDKSFKRNLNYLEQYTTQSSYISTYTNHYFDAIGKEQTACVVNFYKQGESLAQESSAALTDFYAYTFPSFTVNHFYFPGEAYCAMDVNQYVGIGDELLINIIHDSYIEMDNYPSFATISMNPQYDKTTRQLTLDVTGDVAEGSDLFFGDMALTVLLAESNVKAPQQVIQMGVPVINKNYIHNNVFRTYLSAPFGDKLEVSGNKYTARYTYTLPADWKSDDMKIVAYVAKKVDTVNEENQHDIDITNCSAVTFEGTSTAITDATAATSSVADGIYTLDGIRVDGKHLDKGIYIIRKDGKTRKVSF